jgi:hypothetical protein
MKLTKTIKTGEDKKEQQRGEFDQSTLYAHMETSQ